MKSFAYVPALVFLVAALLLPAWQKTPRDPFAFDALCADVQQHFEACTDLQRSGLVDGICFTTQDRGQPLRVHANGHLVLTSDLATGRPIALTLGDGRELRGLLDARASDRVPGWLAVTWSDGAERPPLVIHTNGLMQITESAPAAPDGAEFTDAGGGAGG